MDSKLLSCPQTKCFTRGEKWPGDETRSMKLQHAFASFDINIQLTIQARRNASEKYWTSSGPEIKLHLVHRVTASLKLWPVYYSKLFTLKGTYTELLRVQLTCLDPVPSSTRARNAQGINITNCDVTTWSWVNLRMRNGNFQSRQCP